MIAYADLPTDSRIVRQAKAAAEMGFSVDMIMPTTGNDEDLDLPDQINLHRLNSRYYKGLCKLQNLFAYSDFFIRCFFRTSFLYHQKKYRVIHVHNIPDILVFTTVVPKIFGAKIILDIHDPMPSTYLAKYVRSRRGFFHGVLIVLERMSAAYAHSILTVNEPVKNDVLVKDHIRSDKIMVITNFADGEIFRSVKGFRLDDPLRLIYHGTIARRFGFEAALEAVSKVANPEKLSIKIIGRGDYELPLKKLIRDLKLEKTVVFDNRTYPLPQLPEILCTYHLGIVPYSLSRATDYMLPVKLFELLALGIPSVTIGNAAIRYYLDESMYFAYDPLRTSSLTELLDRIIGDPSLILEKREAILRNRERFLWKNERDRYINHLKSLVQ